MIEYIIGSIAVAIGAFVWSTFRSSWRFESIPDQSGRTVICTGANSGIGFQFCRHMARKNANVILACRNEEYGRKALADIKAEFPSCSAELRIVDVSNKASIKAFADGVIRDVKRLDVLVNNAGVMWQQTQVVNGVDYTFATNNFGPFYLTYLLLPLMQKTPGARVVTVTSLASNGAFAGKSWKDLNDAKLDSFFWQHTRYAYSKAANITFARLLAREFENAGVDIRSTACHPGWAATSLQSGVENAVIRFMLASVGNNLLAQSAEMGATPILAAATDPLVNSGDIVGPGSFQGLRGYPLACEAKALAKDLDGFGEEMWRRSEEWSGVKFVVEHNKNGSNARTVR